MPANHRVPRVAAAQVNCKHSWVVAGMSSGPAGPRFRLRCLLCELGMLNVVTELAYALTGHQV